MQECRETGFKIDDIFSASTIDLAGGKRRRERPCVLSTLLEIRAKEIKREEEREGRKQSIRRGRKEATR